MFTVPTQHVIGDSVEELIEYGIETAREQNDKSLFTHFIESIENSEEVLKFNYNNLKDNDKEFEEMYEQVFKTVFNYVTNIKKL